MSDMTGRVIGLIWILLCLVDSGAHPAQAGAVPSGPATVAIKGRLDHAASVSQERLKNAPASGRDLVFFADFDRPGLALLNGRLLRLDLAADHYRPGRFGRGYYFEKPQQNMLPAAMADVEEDLTGFVAAGGAKLTSEQAQTDLGRRVLRVELSAEGAGFATVPVPMYLVKHAGHEKIGTLLASAFVKGPADRRIRIEAKLLPEDWSPPKGEEARKPDESHAEEIVLTGQWQRVACWVRGDIRIPKRKAVLSVESLGKEALALLADGLQFEQADWYPHNHTMPTTWTPGFTLDTPGGNQRPATYIDLASPELLASFPVAAGTLSFWTCTPTWSNLPKPGSITWLEFGADWTHPVWQASTYTFWAGPGKSCYFGETKVADGKRHHVAMTWDRKQAAVYLDGKPHRTMELEDKEITRELYRLRIGGAVREPQAANSIMDELALYGRKFTEDQVKALAAADKPIAPTDGPVVLGQDGRTVFYRDEPIAHLKVIVSSTGQPDVALTVDCEIGGLLFDSRQVTLAGGEAAASFDFCPGQLKCGKYTCRIAAGESAYAELPIEIVPSLRTDRYLVGSWGGADQTDQWRALCHTLGFNFIDTYRTHYETLGREGFAYCWHYNFGDGVASPAQRAAVRAKTSQAAAQRAAMPNWTHTLVNSEVARWNLPDDEQRKAWFDAWAEKELGFAIPKDGWKYGTTNNPTEAWLPPDAAGKDGVFKAPPALKFLNWWYNRGCGWWRLNAEAAEEIHKPRPDNVVWTDPLDSPGQIADLNAGSNWSYQTRPEPLIGEFEQSLAVARAAGKPFYATLGMDYVQGDWLKAITTDGTTRRLMPTPDDMIQQAWIAVAGLPTEGLTYWFVDGMFHGLRGEKGMYMPPGSDEALGRQIKQDLLPLGTMLKGAGNAPRPVALLLPESTLWVNAGQGGWGWGIVHYASHWKKWLGESGLLYDVVIDANITPGSLGRYKVIIFPMAEYVSEDVHRELQAAAKGGTKIIIDVYGRQEYPGMQRWPQKYFYKMPEAERKDYGQPAKTALAELRKELLAELDAYAAGESGPVLVFVREAGGVKYVTILNDVRQDGPYTQWTKRKDFQPYGKAQKAQVSLKATAGSTVYEFTQSRKLDTTAKGGRLALEVDLPPSGGRVLCVYPAELKPPQLTLPPAAQLGATCRIEVAIRDAAGGPAPGRQLIELTLTDPGGSQHDESGIYRVVTGQVAIPFRPAVNDPPGKWRIAVRERTTGLTVEGSLMVGQGL